MPVPSSVRPDQPTLPLRTDWGTRLPPTRPPKRAPRPKLFGGGADDVCGLVRSVLIETIDRAYCDGGLGRALWRDNDNQDLVRVGLDVLAEIQLVLFPEEFSTDKGLAARIEAAKAGREADSLVPPNGPKRVGLDRLNVYADSLLSPDDYRVIDRRRQKGRAGRGY
jgi:hypothetical protein